MTGQILHFENTTLSYFLSRYILMENIGENSSDAWTIQTFINVIK